MILINAHQQTAHNFSLLANPSRGGLAHQTTSTLTYSSAYLQWCCTARRPPARRRGGHSPARSLSRWPTRLCLAGGAERYWRQPARRDRRRAGREAREDRTAFFSAELRLFCPWLASTLFWKTTSLGTDVPRVQVRGRSKVTSPSPSAVYKGGVAEHAVVVCHSHHQKHRV